MMSLQLNVTIPTPTINELPNYVTHYSPMSISAEQNEQFLMQYKDVLDDNDVYEYIVARDCSGRHAPTMANTRKPFPCMSEEDIQTVLQRVNEYIYEENNHETQRTDAVVLALSTVFYKKGAVWLMDDHMNYWIYRAE